MKASPGGVIRGSSQRIALIVLGMHRSGTSALTRVLSHLGASLPRNLMPAAVDNPAGFWEPVKLVELHDRMLEEAGSRWDDWRDFDLSELPTDRLAFYEREIDRLLEDEYGDAPLFVLKEPRICRFAAFYEERMAQLGIDARFILIHRNPLAVIRSLASRDGTTEGFAVLMWLRHVLDAERATRGRRRVFLAYEGLIGGWRKEIGRVTAELGITWPRSVDAAGADIDGSLRRDLQHQKSTSAELAARRDLPTWIRETYAALQNLSAMSDESKDAIVTISRIYREFEPMAAIFGRADYAEMAAREVRWRDENRGQAMLLEQRHTHIAELSVKKESLADRVESLTDDLATLRQSWEASESARREVEKEKAGLERRLASLSDELTSLRQKWKSIEAARREVATENEELASRLASLSEELATLRQYWVASEASVREVTDQRDAFDASFREVTEERDALRGVVAARESDLRQAMEAKDEADALLARIMHSRSWRLTAPLRNAVRPLRSAVYKRTGALELAPMNATGDQQGRDATSLPEQSAPMGSVAAAESAGLQVEGAVLPTSDEPQVSVIIPVYGKLAYTVRCLRSIAENPPSTPIEVIIVDDGSPDDATRVLTAVPGLRLVCNDTNIGFVRSCNRGAAAARGRFLHFLNNDTEVTPGWCDELVRTFDEVPDAGVVGSKLIFPDGTLQEAGGLIWEDGSGWNWGRGGDPEHPSFNYIRDVDYVSGASLMIGRRLFLESGSFDEDLQPAYYEDTSKCFQIRELGKRVLYQPRSVIVHHEGVSNGTDTAAGIKQFQVRNQSRFVEKHREALRSHLPHGTDPFRASDRMPIGQVLIIDHLTPTPDRDSGSLDMVNLISILNTEGYRMHFVPFMNLAHAGGYTEQLERMGVECVYTPFYTDLRQFLEERGDMFDVVLISRMPVAAGCLAMVRELLPSAAKIFYTVDLHSLREAREAEMSGDREAIARSLRSRELERSVIELADLTVVLSEHEHRLLERLGHQRVRVLPLIRAIPGRGAVAFAERERVAFIGGYQHPPNIDAVRWLVDEIWPAVRRVRDVRGLPAITLELVGSSMPEWFGELADDDVKVIGFVPDLDELFGRLRLTVAPLRYGAGLKGKVATSYGYGVPVVGTSLAFEGMPAGGLDDIVVLADTPWEFAERLVDLYTDEATWESKSWAAVDYVSRHYSLEAIRPRLLDILSEAHGVAARRTESPAGETTPHRYRAAEGRAAESRVLQETSGI